METVSLVMVGLIVVAAFGYALWPLVRTTDASAGGFSSESREGRAEEEIARMFMEREQAYKNILEIELDREMGKLSDEDYEDMIGRARGDALETLRRLESRGVKEGMAPAHVNVNEVAEVASRAAISSAGQAGSPVKGDSGSGKTIDDRLEEEILQYRSVKTPTVQADKESDIPPSKRFCPSCGAEANAAHSFCAACGEKLN